MTRKLRLLDLGLVALLVALALLGWQMRREWVWAHAREQALLQSRLKPAGVPAPPPLSSVEPLAATSYLEMVQKNLFSKDRNPQVIIDPPAPVQEKPVPAFPLARGVMLWPGVPPTIVLSLTAGGEQKGYHPGDTIGEWKIVSVDNRYLGLEWDGKQFKKRLDELLDKTSLVAEAPPQTVAPQSPQAGGATVLSSSSTAKSGPGADVGGVRACIAGDTAPAGTVMDGYRKVVNATPFGSSCGWERAK